uniref:7TM_GPCR_Srx domain-containing protein n=1 Tax=Steinernema glaseri TaxID=37863 RepID=A0A1I8AUK2_9BILA
MPLFPILEVMPYSNQTEGSEWGRELEGRGKMSSFDTVVGLTMLLLSIVAVTVGLFNLYVIKKLPLFHTAFGCFWASRTVGEIGCNLSIMIYSAPVTIFQPKNISPNFGIAAYMVLLFFAAEACAMNQFVSANRLFAVWEPLRYARIFTKRFVTIVIIFTWIATIAIVAVYFVFPCNHLGYSPQFYNFVFVKCPNVKRDYSILTTIINRGCTSVCTLSIFFDCCTLYKIVHVKVTDKKTAKEEAFRRNVRFFAQNVTMMVILITWVITNNDTQSFSPGIFIFEFNMRIIAYLSNGLAIILFNPEVRRMAFRGGSSSMVEIKDTTTRTQNDDSNCVTIF